MTQSLHAIVLKLTANQSGSLHATIGELSHAAFYAAIDAVDPALAKRVHDAEARKPFSLSPLYGYWQSPKDRRIHIGAGQEGWLRLGLLDEELFAAFMQHILYSGVTGGAPGIQLGDIPFTITESLGTPGAHPWVGYATREQLMALDDAPDRWVLEFESPTAIRWGQADKGGIVGKGSRRVEVFPQPRPAIASLRSRWNRMMTDADDYQFDIQFEEWVERNVVVSKVFHWETQPFPYKKQTYVGGLGKLEYRLLDTSNRAYAVHFHRLLHLAFFAGIGYKTTHGLGQVRVVR
ncbi:CRISPR system precrRNA processing endoribonuclease RAMP protein Cas6 [Chloroflexi bacterium TSY]|nr:CRISPR system precrRNA processing endoribonuclease RAMP protein Cas6 [Chloroflexi bacterium TSY]